MPLHGEKQLAAEDQQGDLDSPSCSESLASLSDCEGSRQSLTSDSSSKSSSPTSASPPRVVTFDDVMATARNLSNLALAHEIAVNENFQLKQEALPENSLAGRVKSTVHRAFWDVLESELAARPPEYAHAIRLFEEIREASRCILLSFLTPGGNRLRTQICEVLDPDLIRQQAEHSTVDVPGLASYVIGVMGKLCAPVRDGDIRELKATGNIAEVLRQIYHVLDLMKMDMANFTIWSLRPHLQRQLVEYERAKFQEILDETPILRRVIDGAPAETLVVGLVEMGCRVTDAIREARVLLGAPSPTAFIQPPASPCQVRTLLEVKVERSHFRPAGEGSALQCTGRVEDESPSGPSWILLLTNGGLDVARKAAAKFNQAAVRRGSGLVPGRGEEGYVAASVAGPFPLIVIAGLMRCSGHAQRGGATAGALEQTTEWMRESVKEELLSLSEEAALASGAENSSRPNLSPRLVLNHSYLKLLQWDYRKRDLPETLVTDGTRLQELTEKLSQLKMVACLSLVTSSTVGAVTEGLPELPQRLKRTAAVLLEGMHGETFDLQGALSSIGAHTCAEVSKELAERGFPALGAEVQANLVGQFSSLKDENNPVRALIDKRVQLYMKSLLCLPSPPKSMPPIPGGLAVIQQELEALGTQYANIVNLNMQVYGPFYANILRKLLFGEEASQRADTQLPSD
ncbi:T-complex protein 11-like protein 2 [Fukomys damarensis]|uniref:T-complex protein 11-like protein 2 n=1 Tax=Fukomys damarensis TaxID=885580 RepID=A0A091DGT7_FUKDA|nr:T-complex protein 11-like protein 2 [Fukomys damarensis]